MQEKTTPAAPCLEGETHSFQERLKEELRRRDGARSLWYHTSSSHCGRSFAQRGVNMEMGGGGSPCRPSCFNNLFFTVIKKSITFAYIYIIKMWRVCWYDFSQIFSLSLADRNKLKEKTWFRWCVGRDRKEATLIKGNKTCTSSSSVMPLWHSWVLPGLPPPEKGKLNFSASKLLHWAVLNVTSSYQRAHDDILSSQQLSSHGNIAISKAMNGRGRRSRQD